MKSLSLFALILAGLTLTASAQQYKKPKGKPYHSESNRSEQKQSRGGVTDKKLTPHASNSQELHHVEAQTAKSTKSNGAAKQRARSARVVKTDHEKNPPIHISSAAGSHGSMNTQGKNPYKGRVRQKGSGKR